MISYNPQKVRKNNAINVFKNLFLNGKENSNFFNRFLQKPDYSERKIFDKKKEFEELQKKNLMIKEIKNCK